ncbi:UvrD-helicase domain-containing protein [Streptomyces jumonjinensis]|uniref:UvrD-helicase domain-containing protein n=1 Tax=Streptomyces jumonjinensis TaxID=1945 RepID=UPI002B1F4886|nr:UvrD-helicase domain-containing protein [Streptomyces jumonjinensis]
MRRHAGVGKSRWYKRGRRLLGSGGGRIGGSGRAARHGFPRNRRQHLPRLRGLDDKFRGELAQIVLPYVRRAWIDVQDPDGKLVRFDPNHALKIWALTEPRICADYLLLDEAQDTNPVMEKIFNSQRSQAQLVMVGDSAQAIYGWRGARDVMTDFEGRQLTLSQSFRFGQALADEANRWLMIVQSPLRLRGTPAIDTLIGPLEQADAVLCRTNGGAITEIFKLLEQGKRVALVGGKKSLAELAKAAGDLKPDAARPTPTLCSFSPGTSSWSTRKTTPTARICSRWWRSSKNTASRRCSTP